jgi:hypothetical protein
LLYKELFKWEVRNFSSHQTLYDKFYAVYVVVAAGNSGSGGLQTVGSPGLAPGAMAVASVDNTYTLTSYSIITPNGSKILYQAGTFSGGWKSIVNSTIVVNSQFALYHYN